MYILGQSDRLQCTGTVKPHRHLFFDYRMDVEALFEFECLVVAWDGHSERIMNE